VRKNILNRKDGILMSDNKEVLLGQVGEILEGLVSVASVAGEQLPSICDEIVMYGMVKYGIFFTINILILICICLVTKNFIKEIKDTENKETILFFAFFTGLISLICLIIALPDFLKPIFAPRLFVLEYLKGLL